MVRGAEGGRGTVAFSIVPQPTSTRAISRAPVIKLPVVRLVPLIFISTSSGWGFDPLDHFRRLNSQGNPLPFLQDAPRTDSTSLQGGRRQAALGHPDPGPLGDGDRKVLCPVGSKVEIHPLLSIPDASNV